MGSIFSKGQGYDEDRRGCAADIFVSFCFVQLMQRYLTCFCSGTKTSEATEIWLGAM